ncbi:hypothetical protein DXT89_06740 [Agrobacterium vitis]|uniref:Uncharacterized protein n=1 Tax=Agrobacterium vitis TaxID=373 RepID=A0A368NPG6_AGRVI|nr:hypothetical protein DXM22_09220 [Agrobacterium vitis]KAA3529445.1 hypothetical protein DXT89_06740 [Agrobacterium vitis]RCU52000.1 hypothetical protein ASB66_017575 [Agrobacterium vitis]
MVFPPLRYRVVGCVSILERSVFHGNIVRDQLFSASPPPLASAATFSPLGRRGKEPQRFGSPLPSGERSAEQSGGGVRGKPNTLS